MVAPPPPDRPRLGPRLRAVFARIPIECRLADIGCDHAHLPICAALAGRVRRAIGTDRSAAAVERARRNVRRFEADVEIRHGEGLEVLAPGEANVLVLAGMGGERIRRILSPERLARLGSPELLLVPHRNVPALRGHLLRRVGPIVHEDIVWERGRPYVLLHAHVGTPPGATIDDLFLGPSLRHRDDDAYARYVRRLRADLAGALARARRGDDPRRDVLDILDRELERLGSAKGDDTP